MSRLPCSRMQPVAGGRGRQPLVAASLVLLCGLVPQRAAATRVQDPDTLRVSLEEAWRIGLERRPDLHASRAAVDQQAGNARQAGIPVFNPLLETKATDLISPGSSGPIEIILSQQIEWAGQRGLRSSAAHVATDASRLSLSDAERRARLEIALAWNEAVAATARHRIRERNLDLETRIRAAVDAQAREGQLSRLDVNLARINAGQTIAAERLERLARDTTLFALARAMGLSPMTTVYPAVDTLTVGDATTLETDSLLARALRSRPDLMAAQAEVESARVRQRLASRTALPNLTIGGVADRDASGNDFSYGLRLGFSLPLWNRNQGARDAATAAVRAFEARRAEVENRIRTEVRVAVETWRAAREALLALDAEVAGPARANQDLLDFAFAEGQLDLPSTLLLQSRLIDAEIGFVDAWLAERNAAARLAAATVGF